MVSHETTPHETMPQSKPVPKGIDVVDGIDNSGVDQLGNKDAQEFFQFIKYPRRLASMPFRFRNHYMCRNAVLRDGMDLKDVPECVVDDMIRLRAVSEDYRAFQFVPNEHKTSNLCARAMNIDGRSFLYFPEQFLTAKLCVKASIKLLVNRDVGSLNCLEMDFWDHLPKPCRTRHFCTDLIVRLMNQDHVFAEYDRNSVKCFRKRKRDQNPYDESEEESDEEEEEDDQETFNNRLRSYTSVAFRLGVKEDYDFFSFLVSNDPNFLGIVPEEYYGSLLEQTKTA